MKNGKAENRNVVIWSVLGTSSYEKVRYRFNEDDNQDEYYEDCNIDKIIGGYYKNGGYFFCWKNI